MKKQRRIKYNRVVSLVTFLSFTLYLFTCLFLQSYNNDLSMQLQSIKGDITTIKDNNNSLKINIQSLSSNNRVQDIAGEAGLSLNQNNIISISK